MRLFKNVLYYFGFTDIISRLDIISEKPSPPQCKECLNHLEVVPYQSKLYHIVYINPSINNIIINNLSALHQKVLRHTYHKSFVYSHIMYMTVLYMLHTIIVINIYNI